MTFARPTDRNGKPARFFGTALFAAAMALAAQLVFATPGSADDKAQTSMMSPKDRAAMEEVIRDYILKHPEVILESIRQMRAREEKEAHERSKEALGSHMQALTDNPDDPTGGNPKGDVTIVQFFDYHCGFCKRVLPVLEEVMKTDPNVRVVYKEFPILGEQSVTAAKAALAAWAIDKTKYAALHHALMNSRGDLTEDKVIRLAKESGYDPAAVRKGMAAPQIEKILNRNYELATALNINGTPAFVIGNHLVPGAIDLDNFRKLIAQARKR